MFTSPVIFAELYGRNVVLSRHLEELHSVEMESKRNLKLIEVIQRRSNEAFEAFLEVLNKSSQNDAVTIFKTGETILEYSNLS